MGPAVGRTDAAPGAQIRPPPLLCWRPRGYRLDRAALRRITRDRRCVGRPTHAPWPTAPRLSRSTLHRQPGPVSSPLKNEKALSLWVGPTINRLTAANRAACAPRPLLHAAGLASPNVRQHAWRGTQAQCVAPRHRARSECRGARTGVHISAAFRRGLTTQVFSNSGMSLKQA